MEQHLVLTEISKVKVNDLIDEKEYFMIDTDDGLCVSDGYFIKHHGDGVSHIYLPAVLPLSKEEIERVAEERYAVKKFGIETVDFNETKRLLFIEGLETGLSLMAAEGQKFAEWLLKNAYSIKGKWFLNDATNVISYTTSHLWDIYCKEKQK